jgi:lipopolysaccharide export system protein LptC
MSSPTDIHQTLGTARRDRALKANRRASRARLLSGLALGAGIVLAVGFALKAGLIGAFMAKPEVVVAPAQMPDAALGTNTSIAGFDNQNLPFTLTAGKSFQDATSKNLVHLEVVSAEIARLSGRTLTAAADQAKYDSASKRLALQGNVAISEASGFVATMAAAEMDLGSKALQSKAPVHVISGDATVDANAMVVSEDGKRVLFQGQVKYRLNTP